jgi:hypothetical protein
MEDKQTVYQQQVVVLAPGVDYRVASRGLQPGGVYINEAYCGPVSLIIFIFCCPFVICCPVDFQEVYIEPGIGGRRAVIG